MDSGVFVMFLHLGFSFTACHVCDYHYVNLKMTWADAQHYCREKHIDLATFESMQDIRRLERPNLDMPRVWIGLHDDKNDHLGYEANSWRWSATETAVAGGFQSWGVNEPNNKYRSETCGAMLDSYWNDVPCGQKTASICFKVSNTTGEKVYIFVPHANNWHMARDYCRTHHTDLAMIETMEENMKVVNLAKRRSFMGLYRVPWTWSDGSNSKFKNWQDGLSGELRGLCVAENSDHSWADEDCNQEMPFLCCSNRRHVVRVVLQIRADLSDPSINKKTLEQLGALLTNQGVTDFKLRWRNVPKKDKRNEIKAAKPVQL